MMPERRQRVLFLCTHNSARSQMAEGLLRAFHGDRYESFSAGTEATRVKPLAAEVMAELGIDLSSHRSKTLDVFIDEPLDIVVTVCDAARERCPFFPHAGRQIHHSFEDPSEMGSTAHERLVAFRRIRDEIRAWLDETFAEAA
jgi:arsenate reductase